MPRVGTPPENSAASSPVVSWQEMLDESGVRRVQEKEAELAGKFIVVADSQLVCQDNWIVSADNAKDALALARKILASTDQKDVPLCATRVVVSNESDGLEDHR